MAWRQSERSTTALDAAAGAEPDLPRWVVLCGTTFISITILLLLRFAIDVAGMVCLLMVTGFGLRAMSDWWADGDSAAGWAIGGVGLGLSGVVLVGAWLFGSANIGTELVFHHKVTQRLIAAVDWAEAHGWGQRALLPGGPLDRARRDELNTGAIHAGVAPSSTGAAAMPASSGVASARSATSRGVAPAKSKSASRGRATVRGGAPAFASAANVAAASAEPIATTVTLHVSPATSRVGMSVRLTAAVSSDTEALVEGTVVFRRDAAVLGSVPLRPSPWTSSAYLIVLDLPVGAHALVAEFSGRGRLSASRSVSVPITITR